MKTEVKSLDQLGDKIAQAVELVTRLRKENDALRGKIDRLESTVGESSRASKQVESMRISQERLERELGVLKDERAEVLSRVDGLLSDLARLDLD